MIKINQSRYVGHEAVLVTDDDLAYVDMKIETLVYPDGAVIGRGGMGDLPSTTTVDIKLLLRVTDPRAAEPRIEWKPEGDRMRFDFIGFNHTVLTSMAVAANIGAADDGRTVRIDFGLQRVGVKTLIHVFAMVGD